jgi:Polyketide cyclase / dehydrase and lipid transport
MEPQRNDFLHYECAIHIEASPIQVFSVVGDLGSSVEWAGSGHIRSIEKVTAGPVGVGTKYRSSEKITMSYGANTEIVAYEAGSLIMWKSKPVGERVPYHRWGFWLTPEDGGTRLVHQVRAARARGPMGLVQRLGFLFTKPATTIPPGMERTLKNVQRLAEASAVLDVSTEAH